MTPFENNKPRKSKMKSQIEIVKENEQVLLRAPYSTTNNNAYRARGGKFDRDKAAWIFDDTTATQKMIDDLFGSESPLCRIRLTEREIAEDGNEWKIGGYVIATRRGRDFRVDSPVGVQLENGQWQSSGGSVKTPRVSGRDIVVNIVVRRSFAERLGATILDAEAVVSPLARFSTEELLAELAARETSNLERAKEPMK